jgi:hypothetical protein
MYIKFFDKLLNCGDDDLNTIIQKMSMDGYIKDIDYEVLSDREVVKERLQGG